MLVVSRDTSQKHPGPKEAKLSSVGMNVLFLSAQGILRLVRFVLFLILTVDPRSLPLAVRSVDWNDDRVRQHGPVATVDAVGLGGHIQGFTPAASADWSTARYPPSSLCGHCHPVVRCPSTGCPQAHEPSVRVHTPDSRVPTAGGQQTGILTLPRAELPGSQHRSFRELRRAVIF